ncbi:MAG: DUF4197 domain-containing protein [Chitinophagaceae bacterium]|nr:DUF4197 domain-containing protein [Chitinophagaceae bacterium]
MKRIFTAMALTASLILGSCGSLRNLGGYLSEADAANAIREALIIGTDFGRNAIGQRGYFGRDLLLNAILPQEAQRIVQGLERLGLAPELTRFTNTLGDAAVEAVTRSGPIFVQGIRRMSITDAIGIVRNGGTAATDYLRRTVGDQIRVEVRPVMRSALDQYNVEQSWDRLVAPAKALLGNRVGLSLNLDNILAILITNEMFSRIEQQEIAIRTSAAARTTASLQRVFGRDWSNNGTVRY